MNLVLMKTKNDHFSNRWEPHATSTPLKKTTDQVVVNKTQLLVVKAKSDIFQTKLDSAFSRSSNLKKKLPVTPPAIKRTKKKRSTYFDLSSSSDEDLSDAERPVIKLSSKKKKVLKRNQTLESDDVFLENINTRKKLEKSVTKKNNINISKNSVTGNFKNNEYQVNENFEGQIKSKICCENNGVNQSKENIIVKKSKRRKHVEKDRKLQSKTDENLENIVESYENFKDLSGFKKPEGEPLAIKAEENQKKKAVTDNLYQDTPDLKSFQVEKTQSIKLSQGQKKRNRKILSNYGAVNEIPRKEKTKNFKCANRQIVSTESPQISQNKSNLSHQLFSETVEQEYINILDLTTDEGNKASDSMRCSLQNEKNCQSFIWPYDSSHKKCIGSKNKKVKPQIKKKILENQDKLCPVNNEPKKTQCRKISTTENLHSQIVDVNQQIINPSERFKEEITENKYKKKNVEHNNHKSQNVINTSVNIILSNGFDNAKSDDIQVPVDTLNCLNQNREMNIDTHSNLVDKKKYFKFEEHATNTNSSEKSVFKRLDELVFNEYESGSSVVECCNINNFKCGVFKLKVKAQVTCKTLHKNSHLGGVLLKGNLKIRIGVEEQVLKEGDMTFVPPLTEWEATNNGESESVFYYWCGRF